MTSGVVCGQTGTWLDPAGALILRDTDWYQITVGAGSFQFTGIANGFEIQLGFLAASCPAAGSFITSPSCVQSTPFVFSGPGTFTLFASPNFTNAAQGRPPCVVSYRLNITGPGIAQPGACCRTDGTCFVAASQAECEAGGGVYQGAGTSCDPNPCDPLPTGACCRTDGTCFVGTASECQGAGGAYQGDGTNCGPPNPCAQPTGACCFTAQSCVITTSADCAAQGGNYLGDGSNCGQCPVPVEPSTWGRIKSIYE